MPNVRQSYYRLVWRQFRRKRLALVGLVSVCAMGIMALAAPFLANDVPLYMVKNGKSY